MTVWTGVAQVSVDHDEEMVVWHCVDDAYAHWTWVVVKHVRMSDVDGDGVYPVNDERNVVVFQIGRCGGQSATSDVQWKRRVWKAN